MSKSALFIAGGWDGHEPQKTSAIFAELLQQEGYTTEIADTLDVLLDADKLGDLRLIVPVWTMGTLTHEQMQGLLPAIEFGVGIGGWHGGMADAFRENPGYQFMVGG